MAIYTRHQPPPPPADPPGPPGKWYPWYDGLGNVCTPCPSIPCSLCQAGTTPSQYQVVISGCYNTKLNGTFVLTKTDHTLYGNEACSWELAIDPAVLCHIRGTSNTSNLAWLRLVFSRTRSGGVDYYFLSVYYDSGHAASSDVIWTNALGANPLIDCRFVNLNIGTYNRGDRCAADGSIGTCHATAL